MPRSPAMRQNSFAGGEISPRLFGRTDMERYRQSMQQLRNFIVEQTGVATNRPGFVFVGRTKDTVDLADSNATNLNSTKKVRMVPFVFNEDQSYALEFGENYIRVFTLGGQLVSEDISDFGSHTGITDATVLTDANQAWTVNEFVGGYVRNSTDNSKGLITANTATTITVAALTGGEDNQWENGDKYQVAYQSGQHSEPENRILTDNNKTTPWSADELVGSIVFNVTDGSSGYITNNTTNSVTAVLFGGDKNIWRTNDEYVIKSPVEVVSPYQEEDLQELDFAQQNDVMVITHKKYRSQQLRRTGPESWSLTAVTVTRPVKKPTGLQLEASFAWDAPDTTHPAQRWDWVVTAVDANGNESLPSDVLEEGSAVLYPDKSFGHFEWTAPTEGNDPVAYNLYRGRFGIYGFVTSTTTTQAIDEARVPDFSDSPPSERDPFEFVTTPAGFGEEFEAIFSDPLGLPSTNIAIKEQTDEAFDKLYTYNFGLRLPGDLAGSSDFLDVSLTFQHRPTGGGGWTTVLVKSFQVPDATLGSPWVYFNQEVFISGAGQDHEFRIIYTTVNEATTILENNFQKVTWRGTVAAQTIDSFPSSVCFFEQRLVLGGFDQEPTTIKTSRTGDVFNFDVSEPLKDSDALTLVLASLRRDAIRDLVPLNAVIALTSGAEWVVRGADNAPLGPLNFDLKPKTTYGSNSRVRALPIGDSIVFVTDGQKRVRELIVDPYGTQTASRELSVMAEHLFRRRTAEYMAYSDTPYQVVWVVRSDGRLLGLTYVREHNVFAWHVHDTGGLYEDESPVHQFESACVIPENGESRLYVSVRREINGHVVRYVEASAVRQEPDREDLVLLDSALSYDGRNTRKTNTTGEIVNMRLEPLEGAHDAVDDPTGVTMEDSSETWSVNEHVGQTIKNLRDGSTGAITSNGTDTIVCSAGLSGGSDNQWQTGDEYEIVPSWAANKKLILRAVGKARQLLHGTLNGNANFESEELVDVQGPFDVDDEFNGGTLRNRTDLSTATIDDTEYQLAPAKNHNLLLTLSGQAGGIDNDQDINDVCDIEAPFTDTVFFSDQVSSTQVALRATVLGTTPDDSGRLTKTVQSVRVLINRFIDSRTVEVLPVTAVPTALQLQYSKDWGFALNAIVGARHLASTPVGVIVDGATHAEETVSASGSVTLDAGVFGERVHLGIPYVSEMITLPFDTNDPSLRMAQKNIGALGVELDEFVGVWIGHKRDGMVEMQQRNVSQDYATIDEENKIVVVRPRSGFGRLVNVILQQREALPVSVQSIIADVEVGGRQ